jgi:hypothetical protein
MGRESMLVRIACRVFGGHQWVAISYGPMPPFVHVETECVRCKARSAFVVRRAGGPTHLCLREVGL